MAEKLLKEEAIDLSGREKTKEEYYILDDFIEGKDYCDSVSEAWMNF